MTAPTVNPAALSALVARQRGAAEYGALLEQRHALLDLDADSRFDYPGACCVNCPPNDEEAAA
ncbi:hypothetical protein PV703_15590 [Streptomyces sp. ME01-24h]|nr:hypothetical protein [Streptomyces sp. ME01-24h]